MATFLRALVLVLLAATAAPAQTHRLQGYGLDLGELPANGDHVVSTLPPASMSASRTCQLVDTATPYNSCVVYSTEAAIEADIDLPDLQGILTAAKGGTGQDSSAASGVPELSAGTWSFGASIGDLGTSTSAALATVLTDETGTGAACFATSPTIATPNLTGAIDLNDVAIDDDDCTGQLGECWFDSTDNAFECCHANSGTPVTLGSGGGGGSAVTVDLGDDGGNDTTNLTEIAVVNDAGGAFTVASDKLTIDVANFPAGGGSSTLAVATKTAAYTLTSSDDVILCDTSSAAFTLTLPAAASNSGKLFRVKKITNIANLCTIDPNASETIDGEATHALRYGLEEVEFVSDGTNWRITSQRKPVLWYFGSHAVTGSGAFTEYLPPNAYSATTSATEADRGIQWNQTMTPVWFGCTLYGGTAGGSGWTVALRTGESTDTDWSFSIASGAQSGTDTSGSTISSTFSLSVKLAGSASASARRPRCGLAFYAQ